MLFNIIKCTQKQVFIELFATVCITFVNKMLQNNKIRLQNIIKKNIYIFTVEDFGALVRDTPAYFNCIFYLPMSNNNYLIHIMLAVTEHLKLLIELS